MTQDSLLNPTTTKADVAAAIRPRLGPIATKLSYTQLQLSDGTLQGSTSRTWFDIGADVTGIRLVFANSWGSDVANANAVSVKASIETTPAGTPTDAGTSLTSVFFGGVRTVTIEGGGIAVSDIIPITLKKGTGAYIRNYVSVATLGQKWPIGKFNDTGSVASGGTLDRLTATNVDNVDTADPTVIAATWWRPYMPIAVLGVTAARTVLLAGDSIMAGEATTSTSSDTRKGGYGHRAFQGKAGVINIALGAERSDQFLASAPTFRTRFGQWCTDTFMGYGNNDVHQATNTFAVVAARLQTMWGLFAGMGTRVHAVTITPRTTSTDSWVTTGNQTVHSQNTVRIAINNWIRAGAPQNTSGVAVTPGTAGSVPNPYITTIADVADAVESARDSGIWQANFTGDGTHPTAAGAAAMATAVPTTAILAQGPPVAAGGDTGVALYATRAEAATKLYTPRNINGIPFDGTANISISSAVTGIWMPTDQGLISWAFDPAAIQSSQLTTAGTVFVVGLKVPATTITNVILLVATAGSGLTAGQCFAGLYQGGTLLAATADQATNWASVGAKTMALTSPQAVTAGTVYVAYFSTGTTQPALFRGASTVGSTVGMSAGAGRYGTADTGRTTSLPATLGAISNSSATVWAGVS